MRRRIRTEAVVVQRGELGESDRLVTLLSMDRGKLRAKAPGARRSQRRFSGCLELFAHIEVSLVEPQGGRLARLEEAMLLDPHEPIRADLVAIAHAGYAAELSTSMLGEADEAGEFFRLLVAILSRLDQGPLRPEEIRRIELSVLKLAGIAPHLEDCLACGTDAAEGWMFDHCQGGILCTGCAHRAEQGASTALQPAERELLRTLQAGHLPNFPVSKQAMAMVREVLRRVIEDHLGRPLASARFLRRLAQKTK